MTASCVSSSFLLDCFKMKRFIGTLRGILSFILYAVNTLWWCVLLYIVGAVKGLVPMQGWRIWFTRRLHGVAENWISCNNLNQNMLSGTRWEIQGVGDLNPTGSYLVLANHRSWVDTLVIQRVFNRKIPFLKFFMKQGIKWFPVLGPAWWILDFLFIKRYSLRQLRKNPYLKVKNLEAVRKNCEKYPSMPTSILNFTEGTRFTEEKYRRQASPYKHLLKPNIGGATTVLQIMGERLDGVLDVNIVYPDGICSFWAFISGNIPEIRVHVRHLTIDPAILTRDSASRKALRAWFNNLWAEKDRTIDQLLSNSSARKTY